MPARVAWVGSSGLDPFYRDQVDLAFGSRAGLQRRRARRCGGGYAGHGATPNRHVRLDVCLQVRQEIQKIPFMQQQHVESQPAHHEFGRAGCGEPGIVEGFLPFEVVSDLEELPLVLDLRYRFDPVEPALLADDAVLAHLLVVHQVLAYPALFLRDSGDPLLGGYAAQPGRVLRRSGRIQVVVARDQAGRAQREQCDRRAERHAQALEIVAGNVHVPSRLTSTTENCGTSSRLAAPISPLRLFSALMSNGNCVRVTSVPGCLRSASVNWFTSAVTARKSEACCTTSFPEISTVWTGDSVAATPVCEAGWADGALDPSRLAAVFAPLPNSQLIRSISIWGRAVTASLISTSI